MNEPVYARLLEQIGTAGTIEALRSLRDNVQELMEIMLPSSSVEPLYKKLNEAHDALIRRAIALAEAELARRGKGSPPVPYSYLLFGSGGRSEQTLTSDQDSGLIYFDPGIGIDKDAVSEYFGQLTETIVEYLQQMSYPPCEGNVLAANPEWCMPLSDWKTMLDSWFESARWEVVRYLLIVADARSIYGNETLLVSLKDHFYSDMLMKPIIVRRMLENTMKHKVLIGIFGQLLKERYGAEAGSVDIKYGAYIPLVNAIRLMAVHSGLRETSSFDRIDRLAEIGRIDRKEADAYRDAFSSVLLLRLMTTERYVNGLRESNGNLSGARLTKEISEKLKSALRIGKKLQSRVFKQTMGKLR